MKILIFDIKGTYAHFRKFYTTASPLTFAFPPRTALQGIIGAIMGYKKDKYMSLLKEAAISISLKKPIKKDRITMNFINTKDAPMVRLTNTFAVYFLGLRKGPWHEPHTQIRLEVLKDVMYRVYFSCSQTKVMEELKEKLLKHHSVYTPCLGLANFLADFQFIGEFEGKLRKGMGNYIEVITPVRIDITEETDFLLLEEGKIYLREKMPVQLNENRIPEEYASYLFEPNGKSLKVKLREYTEIENIGNIVWM